MSAADVAASALRLLPGVPGVPPALVADALRLLGSLAATAGWPALLEQLAQLPLTAAPCSAAGPLVPLEQLGTLEPAQLGGRRRTLHPLRAGHAVQRPCAPPPPTNPLPLPPFPCTRAGAQGGALPALSEYQQQVEGRAGAYPVTLALLDLVAAALEAQHTGGPLPTYVLWAANMLLAQRQLRLASAAQQGELIAAALRVLNAALGAGAQADFVPGAADGSRALRVSRLAALAAQALCSHASSYIGAALPPPAAEVSALLQQQPSSGEAEAVLQVAGGLLELLPPLLAAASAAPPLRAPLLGYLLEQAPGPAARLLAYAGLAADSRLAEAALGAAAALAEAAAAGGAPPEALAALLPRGGPLAALLADLAEPAYVAAYPGLWARAARLLLAATPALPALLDGLLLPSGLQQAAAGGEGGKEGGRKGGAAKGAKGGRAARSVLDGLWALVQAAGEGLAGDDPRSYALALQVGGRGGLQARRPAVWCTPLCGGATRACGQALTRTGCPAPAGAAWRTDRGRPAFGAAADACCLPPPSPPPSSPLPGGGRHVGQCGRGVRPAGPAAQPAGLVAGSGSLPAQPRCDCGGPRRGGRRRGGLAAGGACGGGAAGAARGVPAAQGAGRGGGGGGSGRAAR